MREDSIAASIYMRYLLYFYQTLFHKQIVDSEDDRYSLMDSHNFLQTHSRILNDVRKEGANSRYQIFCERAYPDSEYSGDNPCAYNVARSMAKSKYYPIHLTWCSSPVVSVLEKLVTRSPWHDGSQLKKSSVLMLSTIFLMHPS